MSVARERAASTQDALDHALTAHRAAVDERDERAAHAAAAHEEEATRLLAELDQARTAVATARAQAEASDHRASAAEDASRAAADRASEMEASMSRLRVDAAKAQAAIEAATLRAEVAERQLDQAAGGAAGRAEPTRPQALRAPRTAGPARRPDATSAIGGKGSHEEEAGDGLINGARKHAIARTVTPWSTPCGRPRPSQGLRFPVVSGGRLLTPRCARVLTRRCATALTRRLRSR